MPTPSSNAPDPPSPRSFPFSSCPDPEDQPNFDSASQAQLHAAPAPESPLNWRPLQSAAHPRHPGSRADRSVNDDPATSQSAAMSPAPEPERVRDVDMGQEPGRETEGMAIAQDSADEGHKRTDTDEDALAMSNARGRREIGAVAAGSREGVRTASGDALSRRQQATERSPVVGEIHEVDVWGPLGKGPRWVEDSGLVGLGNECSHTRIIPSPPPSYLRPGSRFVGTQQSERQRYDVEVEIKHVDLRESFLCGYLRIQGRLHFE